MAKGFSISLNDTEVKKTLGNMIKAAKDFREPLEEAGKEMLDIYGNRVFQQQGANQDPWKPLSAATLMMREKRQGHYALPPKSTNKILVWTGSLMGGFVKHVDSFKLTIENTVDYFKYHQKSQRKMLHLNKEIITLVMEKMLKYTNKSMK